MDWTIDGKEVLVTGANSGIGEAAALRFAAAGAKVVIAARDGDASQRVVNEIEAAGGSVRAFAADASDEQAVAALFENAEAALGPVEVAVFNAAGFTIGSILDTTVETFEDMWRASALGGFLVGREAARRMVPRERGVGQYNIVL